MKQRDRLAWMAKNERLNADRVLKVGDAVVDPCGHTGIVVRIEPVEPPTDADPEGHHGSVSVWQDARHNHGADNCEHYPFTNWRRQLRIRTPSETTPATEA